MSNEVIFWTQIASIVAFIGTTFVLYRLLVSQKDATIETLKTQIEFLREKQKENDKNEPDKLVERLNQRKLILEKEIESLGADNVKEKQKLEAQIKEIEDKAQNLEDEVDFVNELLDKYSCPKCKAPLVEKGFAAEAVEHNGKEYEVDHEWASFECGYKIADGKMVKECRSKPNAKSQF